METIELAEDGVDLWIVRMDPVDQVTAAMLPRSEDRARYEQIVPPRRRRQFIFRRVALHHVLRQYAGQYRIETGANGKPSVRTAGQAPLYFSASSSGALCAVGVSRRELGVDLEGRSGPVDINAICERYVPRFAGMSTIWKNSRIARQLALCAWCRTEAYVKLHGLTLHAQLFHADPAQERPSSDIVVSGQDFVCVVSQSSHRQLKNIHHIEFNRISEEAAWTA